MGRERPVHGLPSYRTDMTACLSTGARLSEPNGVTRDLSQQEPFTPNFLEPDCWGASSQRDWLDAMLVDNFRLPRHSARTSD